MEQLKILQRAFDLYLYLYIALKRFPKSEKFAMAQEIKILYDKFTELVITANKSTCKKKLLYEADVKLELLRFKLRAAHQLQFLKTKQYEILTAGLSEIGKMLGGWIKSVN